MTTMREALNFILTIMCPFLALFLSSFHAMLCHITDIRVGPTYGAVFSFNKIGYGIGTFTGML